MAKKCVRIEGVGDVGAASSLSVFDDLESEKTASHLILALRQNEDVLVGLLN